MAYRATATPVSVARLSSQALSGSQEADPVGVARRLLAVQAQDPRGARLAIRVRAPGTASADVDRALSEERSLVVTWLNRGTLHLVRREDYPWLHALTVPRQRRPNERRLAEEGVGPDGLDRGLSVIERSLVDEGPLSRSDLADRLRRASVPTEGQALYHLLLAASIRGIVVRGPVVGAEQGWALVRDWLGEQSPPDPDRALTELARRYLAGHGPASEHDLARWAGIGVREARRGLRAIGPELAERPDGLADLTDRPAGGGVPAPRLLGQFDPLLLGWSSRAGFVPEGAGIVTSNGIFRPFALVGGRAAGTWRLERGRVALEPFGELDPGEARALAEDAADVVRFLGAHGR